mgnify:CR=1 FL=1
MRMGPGLAVRRPFVLPPLRARPEDVFTVFFGMYTDYIGRRARGK